MKEKARGMYELRDASRAQRLTLAGIGAVSVALAWWLLLDGGIGVVGGWFNWKWAAGAPIRRAWLVAGLCIYYVRLLFTEFVFLKRGVSWSEVFAIAPWLLFIVAMLGIAGGTNPAPLHVASVGGAILFAVGSWMNSYAEFTRHKWKLRPKNRERLYTGGLFRYSRHPNYLGDLLSFSGLCLISGAWATVVIPVVMLAGFVFVNIPMLDSHLRDHYGSAFDDYARRTRKLIPFVY